MCRCIMLMTAIFAFGMQSAACAEVATLEDFNRFCLATRAEPKEALAVAERSGWTPAPPELAQYNIRLGGSPDGREINVGGADYRALSVGYPRNGRNVKTCTITSRASFSDITTGVSHSFGPPFRKTSEIWAWTLIQAGGVTKSIVKESDFNGLRPDRTYQIFAYPLEGGSVISMDEFVTVPTQP